MMAYLKHIISRKIFLLTTLFVGLGFIFLKSCKNPKEREAEKEEVLGYTEPIVENPISLKYEKKVFESEGILPAVTPEDNPDTTNYKVEYVQFEDTNLNFFALSLIFFNNDARSVEDDFKIFVNKQLENRYDTEYPNFPWEYITTMEVLHAKPNYVGLSVDNYSYTGGAHGNNYEIFYHYDPINQKEFEFSDLIDTVKLDRIRYIGEKTLRSDYGLPANVSLTERFFFENGQFNFPRNFRIENNGDVVFLYNIYEILPYSEGRTALKISYKDISPAFTNKGKAIVDGIVKGESDK